MSYVLLADIILIIHFTVIVFITVGQGCIIIGGLRNWHWVRNYVFRTCHLAAVVIVMVQTWFDEICFLTVWEAVLRQKAGGSTYTGTFVQHWVGRLVFYNAPNWVFTSLYTLFALVVFLSWIYVRPGKMA